MIGEEEKARLRSAHRDLERARDRVWLERVRAGLEYRRAMRETDGRVATVSRARDERIREAVARGASYREVGRALGLSHSRIQQIVNADGA